MISSILYATDLGLYAPYVLQHALSLASAYHAELYVVHAVEPMGLFADSVLQTYLDTETLAELRATGLSNVMGSIEKRVMEGFRDEIGEMRKEAEMIRSVRVLQGDPPLVILGEAQRLGVDLIVAGSHSHGDGMSTPLGRTAARVVQLAEVPVYLVPMLQHRG
ncbi:universal stress protein [Pseudomonas panipatensis]|uniref:Nucleotide-binding universal stress protein, UspA family n=1 Tax=Pseudomonas panipatensis TaxID=428992 RepID=A0A1G8F902_9PSED|nr:universal stress protein [Pseudomonas panipatensis]SDH78601.1 Nucleotide-binding universal stress protein, UspA family [Pseudomonas panipatensis]SMP54960.1 Nucleotide-binding universal stress protein, UspA family [Pseudomonas panipatensis]